MKALIVSLCPELLKHFTGNTTKAPLVSFSVFIYEFLEILNRTMPVPLTVIHMCFTTLP